MEDFIKHQITATLKYFAFHWIASYCKPLRSPAVEEAQRKLGCNFVKGICHPSEDYAKVRGAGVEWNRADIEFPFDAQGNIRQEYIDWKEKARRYKENGIRVMVVTPYPRTYIEHGVDPRTPEGEARVREIALFLLDDLKDIADIWQITNEMGIPNFIKPLTMREAVRFIGVQLEAMYPHRGDALIGYNSTFPGCDLHGMMRPWLQYCDYVGIDIYVGCFVGFACWLRLFDAVLRYLWSMTGKPILLAEFGYISAGAPKSQEEKQAILQRYGVSSEKEAKANADQFMAKLKDISPKMHTRAANNASGRPVDFLFSPMYRNHFYSELPKRTVIKKYPHTPEGQAGFYRDIFPRLAELPFMLGAFIYKWNDRQGGCGHCGQEGCPTETRWGIVDGEHSEKPSYYAVRDAWEGM